MRYTSTGPFCVISPAPALALQPASFPSLSTVADETPGRGSTFCITTVPSLSFAITRLGLRFGVAAVLDASGFAMIGVPACSRLFDGNELQPAMARDIATESVNKIRFILIMRSTEKSAAQSAV